MNRVYILQENATRDGLNFDYFCSSIDSLVILVKKVFKERFEDDWISIDEILIGTSGTIIVHWEAIDKTKRVFDKFTYITVNVK